MERQEFIYFVLGAFSLAVGFIVQPYVKAVWKWCKSLIPHKKTHNINNKDIEYLLCKIEEQQKQIDNVAETLATRDKNRKYNTRREIREYLEELRTK